MVKVMVCFTARLTNLHLIKILWMHSLKLQSLLRTKFILKALLID
ncbi:hypothetical protein H098_03360 [Pseudomonas fluorescens FH5]|nr:hypothetical protein H098_03360 [Pseudomonas fluorescens FH5]